MSQTLAVEISDQLYAALQRRAEAAGTSPAAFAADSLATQFGLAPAQYTEADRQAARQRFESHFGEVNLGAATGADNESIDADLAKQYAGAHESA